MLLKNTLFTLLLCVICSEVVDAQTYYFNKLADFPSTHINCLAVDAANVKWVGTEHGLVRFEHDTVFQVYHEKNSAIRDAQINCIRIDSSGNKWLGSYSKGLMRLDRAGNFHYYPFANSKILLITAIAFYGENEILVATSTDGVYVLKEGKLHPKWQVRNAKLLSNQVNSMQAADQATLLIGTAKGLCEVKGKQWKLHPKLERVKDLQLINQVWYASALTSEGPKFWQKKAKKWENLEKGLFNYPFQFKKIVPGNPWIWITSDRGLVQFDGKKSQLFDARYGLSEAISCVALDQDSILWVGSIDQGLFKKGKRPQKEKVEQASVMRDGIQVNVLLRLKYARFLQGTTAFVSDSAAIELQQVVEYLHEHPETRIEIHGHTDDTGSQLKNWELSKQRTQVIVQFFRQNQIASERIVPIWHGENKPFVPNTSEENKRLNRRVEIRIRKQR